MYEGHGSLDRGVSGAGFDRFADRYDDSAIHRMKKTYWTTKQHVISKLGKRQDDHLIASDAELDAKLEAYKALKTSCDDMAACIENYQDYICDLSQDENSLGRFLKERGKSDKTQAGKIMAAVGRAQSYTAQQRLALRVPLVRLYQELEVFITRAVADTQLTVDKMEAARTRYRGSLLWMKNISESLDPDSYGRLEKFRAVQAQVKQQKARFDKYKLDVLQKVDLLAASRCNMFSQILASYQQCLVRFWEKTSKTHEAVSDAFKGYQHYEFTVVKELAEPSKRLAELTSAPGAVSSDSDQNATENQDQTDDELITLQRTEVGKDATDAELAKDLEGLFMDSPEHQAAQGDTADLLTGNRLGLTENDDILTLSTAENPDAQATTSEDATLMELLGEIDAATAGSGNEFGQEWERMFGSGEVARALGAGDAIPSAAPPIPNLPAAGPPDNPISSRGFLPSQLWNSDHPSSDMLASLQQQPPQQPTGQPQRSGNNRDNAQMSAWFSLFADIDPLANPDSIGGSTDASQQA